MEPVYVFGTGVRAHVATNLIQGYLSDRYRVAGYYDDRRPEGAEGPGGYRVLGTVDEGTRALSPGRGVAFLALGTYASWRSCEILLALKKRGVGFARLIAPGVHAAPNAAIGANALIMPGVFVGTDVRIGDLFTAHGGCVVEHHGSIGHNVLLGPGAVLSGFAVLESHVFMGSGAVVLPERRVAAGSIVGAGSVVVDDVPPSVVALGSPARRIRDTGDKDEVPSRERIQALLDRGLG